MVYCGILWYSVLEGVLVLSPTADWLCSHEETPSPKDCNPFLAAEVKEDPSLDLALQALATETSRRAASKLITTSGQPGFPRPTISSGLKPHTVLHRHYLIHRVVFIHDSCCSVWSEWTKCHSGSVSSSSELHAEEPSWYPRTNLSLQTFL